MKCMKLFYDGQAYPLTEISNWSVTSKIGGTKTMQFDIAPQTQIYKCIEEEVRIEYDGAYYNIKSINERRTTSTVTAEIDLDGLRGNIFQSFITETVSLAETLEKALEGTGWSVAGAGLVSSKRSMNLSDVTPLDIVNKCTNKTMYNVSFDADNINKVLKVSIPGTVVGNVYFTDSLNLKELSFKGTSGNFITRLYAYGKDGLSFADINDGKDYVDNHTYSDKVIAAVWRDERYTIKESLLADAKEKLLEMAVPERSYTCGIIDIAKLNQAEYEDFYIRLNEVVTLIDRNRNKRIEHTVVEIKEYPNEPDKNAITLSTTPEKLSRKLTDSSIQIGDISNTVSRQPSLWEQAIKNATALITGASGGYVVLNPSENPQEILILDTPDIETAVNVWRWNSGGLGHSSTGYNGKYTTAMTMDGSIVADLITSGTLQGVKIIGTTGSIAGWEIDNDVLISADGSLKIDSKNNTITVNDDSGNRLMVLSKSGVGFYRDGKYIGFIGTNRITNTDDYGLVFDLETDGSYMSWGVKEEADGNYIQKLVYKKDTGFTVSGDMNITGSLTVNGKIIG